MTAIPTPVSQSFQRPDLSFGYSNNVDLNKLHPWQAPFGLASREIDYDDGWRLWCAAENGDTKIVESLLAKDHRLKDLAFRYHCPLDLAIYGGHVQCVSVLLSAQSELAEKWGWFGWDRMLEFASDLGHQEIHAMMHEHLRAKFNFDSDIDLMIQALCDQDVDRMTKLLDQKPDRVSISDSDGNTALHWAVVSRQIPMIDLLVERGANPSRRNGAHCMPHQVKMWTKRERQMIRGLEDWQTFGRPARRRTLELGAEVDFHTAVGNGDLEQVKLMLANQPALVHHMPGSLGSPLALAVPNIEMVQLLLDHQADPTLCEFTAPFGKALYVAVCSNNYECAELLLKNGCDPMSYSDSSGDCLFATRWIGNENDRKRMTNLLNKYSGKEHILIPQRNKSDEPSAEEAREAVREVLARETITDWQVAHLLEVILHYQDAELLDEFIGRLGKRATAQVSQTDARDRQGKLLDTLTKNGAIKLPVDTSPKWLGATILHWNRDVSFVAEFIEAGGDINSVDLERHRTALSNAAEAGQIEMVKELLEHGANPNLPRN